MCIYLLHVYRLGANCDCNRNRLQSIALFYEFEIAIAIVSLESSLFAIAIEIEVCNRRNRPVQSSFSAPDYVKLTILLI